MTNKKELNNEELDNVTGGCGGGSGNCDECDAELKHTIYWTCTFTEDIVGKEKVVKEFKLCGNCAAIAKKDSRYSNWVDHLGE